MGKKRLLASMAAALAVAFALAGCSIIPNPFHPNTSGSGDSSAPAASGGSGAPKVGECWNATNSEADNWSDWEGQSATPCSTSHVLYTYAIGKIEGVSAKTWAKSGSPDQTSTAVADRADDACSTEELLPKLKWTQQLIQGFFFLPSKADWRAGARWVRCDVGVLSYGTTIDNEALATLPAKISTLVAAVSSDPKRYNFCVTSPSPVNESGPLDSSSGRIADCRTDPQWVLEGHGNFPEPAGAAFPTDATANKESGDVCLKYVTDSNETWIAYIPSKSDWTKTNDREIDCWVGQKADADVGGGTA
ncbi:MAG TPA: septum formation family protein [Galbitalea sp.]|jgi:hypothetical protein|nr:septum formation family protein [Galbitalea sp.]